MVHAGLALYDLLSIGDGLPRERTGSIASEIAALPRLRREGLTSILHYHDCQADDARLMLAVLLDARARGADIKNRRAVTAIAPLENGYGVELDERGLQAAHRGPLHGQCERALCGGGGWPHAAASAVARPYASCAAATSCCECLSRPRPTPIRCKTPTDRVIFVLPWLDGRFLIVGTTDVPHTGDPGAASCSAEEEAYLLAAYNRSFARPAGPATAADIVFTWSGVRALADDKEVGRKA